MVLQSQYDYIITGAGCAGLSLVMHMIASGELINKTVLIIDKDAKTSNDRTWCFWEKEADLFEPIVYKTWEHIYFYSHSFSSELNIQPYQYKLIRGIDFYQHCLSQISAHPNITFLQQPVQQIHSGATETYAVVNNQKISCQYIFNSILFQKPLLQKKDYWLLQHFRGWVIETDSNAFDSNVATLMDFRTGQKHGATFFYLLPFAANKALIEYTLFSKEVLPIDEYDKQLHQYIQNTLQIKNYSIKEEEFGVIPMTNYRFNIAENNIINIGTAGGQTKASSGYTFKFIQKSSKAIVAALMDKKHPAQKLGTSRRFAFYDATLLHILHHNTFPGDRIFSILFEKNKPAEVFCFLDNETNLVQDIKIIASLPTLPFLKASIKNGIGIY